MLRHSVARAENLGQAEADAAYSRWAPIYDLVFDSPFYPARLAAARAAGEATPPGGELLVVGVGTGLELELLPPHPQVIGVDLSAPMLAIARQRVKRKNLTNVNALLAMDAGAMTFEPARFDCVLAPYVLSVVPDPQLVLDQIWRVLRPGGELVIATHFWAETGPRGWFESWLDQWASWLGWRPAFPFAAVGEWVARHPDALWRERREIAPLKLFTLLRIGKRA